MYLCSGLLLPVVFLCYNQGMKRFNTTGTCFADKHYMVNIDARIRQIKEMVDRGDYFCGIRGMLGDYEADHRTGMDCARMAKQLADYLDYYGVNQGYLVSFCFTKGKQSGVREVSVGGRTIVEAVV